MNRRLIIVTLLAIFAITACKKDSLQPSNAEVTGQVLYGGNPAADGLGYYIRTDDTHENLSPQNLPVEYKHTDINTHVAIRYFDTGSKLPMAMIPGATGPRIVVIRSIRKL